MKKIIFILFFTFLSTELFAYTQCAKLNQFKISGGISGACGYPSTYEILFEISSGSGGGSCDAVAFGCATGFSEPQQKSSTLPDWVIFNPEETDFNKRYKCNNKTTLDEIFEDDGIVYYCKGSSGVQPIKDAIGLATDENGETIPNCINGTTNTYGSGFTILKGTLNPNIYRTYECSQDGSSDNENIFDESFPEVVNNSENSSNLTFEPTLTTLPDGSLEWKLPNGEILIRYPNNTIFHISPDGVVTALQQNSASYEPSGTYIKHSGTFENGNKYWKMSDDTIYLLKPDNTLITYNKDNTSTTQKVDSSWKANVSYGFGGSSSGIGSTTGTTQGSGTGSSTQANTKNENSPDEIPELIPEPTPEEESLNCSSPDLTVQQKLLCEVNKGIKQINKESTPEYSLNNLLNTLLTDTQLNDKAIIYNTDLVKKNFEKMLANAKSIDNLTNENNSTSITKNIESQNDKLIRLNETLKTIKDNLKNQNNSGGGSTPNANLDEYLKSDSTVNTDNITNNSNETDSKIDNLISIYSNFASNIQNSTTTIIGQINSTKSLITGVNNIFEKENVITCPISYTFDLNSYDLGLKNIDLDICKYFSELQSLGYFIVYFFLMFVLVISTINILGVLL